MCLVFVVMKQNKTHYINKEYNTNSTLNLYNKVRKNIKLYFTVRLTLKSKNSLLFHFYPSKNIAEKITK